MDKNTIPALFTAITGRGALNEGETGFNSRQTLDLLLSRTTQGYDVKTVVDFGGVNDVVAGCDRDLGVDATVQDGQIRDIFENDMKYKGVLPDATGHFLPRQNYWRLLLANLMPTAMLAEDVRGRLGRASALKSAGAGQPADELPSRFVCDKDRARADAVVDALLRNWSTARMVAEAHGLKFLAVLEPTAYLGQARRDHLSLDRELGIQLVTVYGLLRKKIAALDADWILDMTDLLDGLRDEYVYIDYSHVSANGNRAIAEAIATRLLAPEQSKSPPLKKLRDADGNRARVDRACEFPPRRRSMKVGQLEGLTLGNVTAQLLSLEPIRRLGRQVISRAVKCDVLSPQDMAERQVLGSDAG